MRSSMPLILTLVALTAPPAEGRAQQARDPQITLTRDVPQQASRLNIEDIAANAPVSLAWRAVHDSGVTYRWELTLDRARDQNNQNVTFLSLPDDPLCTGICEGPSSTGVEYRFQIRPLDFIRSDVVTDNARAQIFVRVFRDNNSFDPDESSSADWTFEVDTRRPPAPTLVTLVPAERRLTVRWEFPAARGDDIEFVTIAFCPDIRSVTSSSSGALDELPCDPGARREERNIGRDQRSFEIEADLQNDVPAAVSLKATDAFGNEGAFGNVLFQTPQEVTDFWELYQGQRGGEDGGFCFVATAAHGSYAHPVVRLLRVFRDRVLGWTPLSRGLTYGYYRVSPELAARVAASEDLAQAARIGLLPATAAAVGLLALPAFGGLVLLLIAVRALRRWRTGPVHGGWALLLCLTAATLAPGEARAQRPESALDSFGLGFEFRGGPYLPSIGQGDIVPGEPDAFVRIFGSRPNPLYSLGAEVQVYRGLGTVALGGSFGFMQWVGRAFVSRTGERASNDTTVFNLLPLTLTLGYRFDWLVDHTFIPFVPYVRGGLAYYVWWSTNGRGEISRVENPQGNDFIARGGRLGFTGSLGVAFLLNVLEPRAARALFDATNVRGTYFFAEVTSAQVDGFGSAGFDLSDATWSLGLFLEL